MEGEPNTARGRRRIPNPKELAAVLNKEQRRHVAELKLRAGPAWCGEFGELVFPTPRAGRGTSGTFSGRWTGCWPGPGSGTCGSTI